MKIVKKNRVSEVQKERVLHSFGQFFNHIQMVTVCFKAKKRHYGNKNVGYIVELLNQDCIIFCAISRSFW